MKQIFDIKRLWQSFIHTLLTQHYYLWWICLAIAIITIIFSFNNINYFHIDFGWHIASSTMFERYGFHGRNSDRFHGLINNLFYPPAEDTIVRIISLFNPWDHIGSFLSYISLVILWYWIASYMIIRNIKNNIVAIMTFLWLALFFFLDKTENISYFQWGSLMDLLFTWLTSQWLGITFFLFFIAEYLRKTPKVRVLSLWAILTFISHLVVWPVAFLLLGLYILHHRKIDYVKYFLLSIGITSFFWIPFIYYKSIGSSAFIVRDLPLLLLIVSLLWAIISYYYRWKNTWGLFIASILIIFPNYLSIRWEAFTWYSYPLPVFHYYRFASIALLCTIIWWVQLVDFLMTRFKSSKLITLWSLVSISVLLWITWYHFEILSFDKLATTIGYRNKEFTDYNKIETLYPTINNGKKIFTIDVNRPIDFGLDSYFQYMTPGLPFVKGLFWESYKWNQLESSYIASLLAPQNIVLDFHYTNTREQGEYNRLRDGFIQTYDIWRILVWPPNKISYLNQDRHNMIATLIAQWTVDHTFTFTDSIVIQWITFELYQINNKIEILETWFIRPFTTDKQIIPINLEKQHFSEDILNIIKKESPIEKPKDLIYFDKKNIPDYTIPIWSGKVVYTTDWTSYSIDLGTSPQSIVIRIPNLPWRTIEWENNQSIQVSHGIYDKIISWTGKITISYHRTRVMIMSYILSLLSLSGFIYCIYKHKK